MIGLIQRIKYDKAKGLLYIQGYNMDNLLFS